MSNRSISLAFLSLILSASAAAVAQAGEQKEVISNGGLFHTLEAAPVTGQPYSAVQHQKTVQTLPDGSKVNRGEAHHAVLRDSAGRVRVEQVSVCRCRDTKTTTVRVFVLDPVAHTLSTWSTDGEKVAMVYKLPETINRQRDIPVSITSASGARSNRPQPVITTENLGTEMLDNVPVAVVKTTTIVPPGRSGNESAITKTHQVWTSQDMKLVLKEQWNDPRTGERTVELTDFARTEPNPALFRVPADFKTKDLKQTLEELQQKIAELQAKL
jgi:hypothetical protein